jgi:hypothetical protein
MKAMQKIIHLSLVVAILLASMGFRMNVPHCSDEKGGFVSLFADPGCCCDKAAKAPAKSCQEMACVLQQSVVYQTNFNSATQQAAKFLKEPAKYPVFAEAIRPVLLEKFPHFTLPPPVTGRTIGILHKTFIV